MRKILKKIYLFVYWMKSGYIKKNFSFKTSDFNKLSVELNKSVTSIIFNYIYNVIRYGVDLHEYVIYDFYQLDREEKDKFITRINKFEIYNKFNKT